mmetsp:Transcript_18062/g.28065  ORF Transcript_18062/g.28065 Transcript_18062/m.28065 type:complete len:199 (+) Transcript_18062:74-670(+)
MQALNKLCSGIKGNEHPIEGDVKAMRAILNCKQYNKSLASYHDEFREAVKTITLRGCRFKLSENSIKAEKALDPKLSDEDAANKAHDRFLAIIFLNNLKEKPTALYAKLKDDYLRSVDSYPENSQEALDRVITHNQSEGISRNTGSSRSGGQVTLAQSNRIGPLATHPCHLCGSSEHWAPDCPGREERNNTGNTASLG